MAKNIWRLTAAPVEGIYTVTPDLAQRWLTEFNYKHQRRLRPSHVSTLAKEMEAGRFLEKTPVHFCCIQTPSGLEHVNVNGQHTLSAIVRSGVSAVLSVIITKCSTWDEIADVFARHDTHLTRQMSDSLVAHEMDLAFGITRTQLQWVTASTLYFCWMTKLTEVKVATAMSHDEKLNLVRAHGEKIIAVFPFIDGHTSLNWVKRRSTLACMALINAYDPEMAFNFWRPIVEDDGLRVGDPRKSLLKVFTETVTAGGGSNSSTGKKTLSDAAFVKCISLAWNAHVEQRTLQFVRPEVHAKSAVFKNIGTFRA